MFRLSMAETAEFSEIQNPSDPQPYLLDDLSKMIRKELR